MTLHKPAPSDPSRRTKDRQVGEASPHANPSPARGGRKPANSSRSREEGPDVRNPGDHQARANLIRSEHDAHVTKRKGRR